VTASSLPTVATWLMKRIGTNEALIGDLVEEYHRRQSRTWYWRQTLAAILMGSYRDVRSNKLLAFRALLVGWALSWVFFRIVFFPLADLDEWLFVRGIADIRSWWPKGPIPYFVVGSFGCIGIGWVIARFHRPPMLLMFVVSVMMWNFSWLPIVMSRLIWWPYYRSQWYFYTFLIQGLLAFVVMTISLLLGGLLVPTREPSRSLAMP